MDLITVLDTRVPRTREELVFAPGDRPLGGGTWLFSEEQPDVSRLVDLTGLGWPDVEEPGGVLRVAATCTIGTLAGLPAREGWAAHPLFAQCAAALLASFKIQNIATVGGNIALALPAGPMTALGAALDAEVVLWTATDERRMPVADFVRGVQSTAIEPTEVVRAIDIPLASLRSRTAFRRISLSPLGRTGTLVIARLDDGGSFVLTITGGTDRPEVLRFDALPGADELAAAVHGIESWYDDAHGSPDWRRAMSARFAEQVRLELGGAL